MPEPEFLTVPEVAALLRTSPGALYGLRHRGVKPAAFGVQVGRRLLWRRSDIEAWFTERQEDQLAEMAS